MHKEAFWFLARHLVLKQKNILNLDDKKMNHQIPLLTEIPNKSQFVILAQEKSIHKNVVIPC